MNTDTTPRRIHRREFRDRVVVITGSSRGIGRETARLLLHAGARVVLNGRTASRLEQTLDTLRAEFPPEPPSDEGRVSAIACDISTEEGARELVRHATERWGRIDALINNAGVSMRGAAAQLRASAVDSLAAGNLRAAVLPTVAALPELEARNGRVLFVSTVAAIHGFPGVSLYSATKAAVHTFAEALDAEVRGAGVTVGVVMLGFVENDPEKTTPGADGTAFHHERRAMQTQAQAAAAIATALARRRRRTITVGAGRLLDIAHRVTPGLVGAVLARSGGRIHRVSRDE